MEKRLIIFGGIVALSLVGAGTVFAAPKIAHIINATTLVNHLVLDKDTAVIEKDDGYLHQADVKNGNKIDAIGFAEVEGAFGSIKKADYGTHTWNGMIYNRSVINGFESLTVTFTGGTLHYVFTDFLMQDMDFNSTDTLVSGEKVDVPSGKAYFLIYNESTTPVTIQTIDIAASCDGSIDSTMIYSDQFFGATGMGGARSLAKKTTTELGFVEIENNPTKDTNNYSRGNHVSSSHDDSWYRWNGRFFSKSDYLGTDFSFGMTIVGNISQIIDENKFFHYNVWPQFGYDGVSSDALLNSYIQTYIGNDNYEPLGKDAALHKEDPYTKESYTGRFFTDYGVYDEQWKFCDPDTTFIEDGVTTFRQAYEAYDLPFWFIRFDVFFDAEKGVPVCDVTINGFKLFSQEIFDAEDYDAEKKLPLYINTLPMHLVNYGVDIEANPDESYVGSFTYPRLIA